MDNEMIIDFINNVEPDFSYGTSDGMSRAMVESAENIALINDYIIESTYDVYTEAEGDDKDDKKPGFLGKISNKISRYFTLFMNIIKKFIAKIKGFFLTLKKKITIAFTKAVKGVANFLRKRINNNKSKFDTNKDITIYAWNAGVLQKAQERSTFTAHAGDSYRGGDYEAVVKYWKETKDIIDNIAVVPTEKNRNSLLSEVNVTFDPNKTDDFLEAQFKSDVLKNIDTTYDTLMKQTDNVIKNIKEKEKDIRKEFNKSDSKSNNERKVIKDKFKSINYAINQYTLLKYRVTQKVASACFKYYKKLFSAVRGVIGGFNISGDSDDYKASSNESTIIDLIK